MRYGYFDVKHINALGHVKHALVYHASIEFSSSMWPGASHLIYCWISCMNGVDQERMIKREV